MKGAKLLTFVLRHCFAHKLVRFSDVLVRVAVVFWYGP